MFLGDTHNCRTWRATLFCNHVSLSTLQSKQQKQQNWKCTLNWCMKKKKKKELEGCCKMLTQNTRLYFSIIMCLFFKFRKYITSYILSFKKKIPELFPANSGLCTVVCISFWCCIERYRSFLICIFAVPYLLCVDDIPHVSCYLQ